MTPVVGLLVGGVSQLYQGDLDLGRVAAERLSKEPFGPHVAVEDLHYGAVSVAQRLEELRPGALVLVGAELRGRPPASVERRRIRPLALPASDAGRAIGEAATGYVGIDLVVEVGSALGALPERTVAVEVEPVTREPAERLSPGAEAALGKALELVRVEVRRAPLFELAVRIRERLSEARLERTPALECLESLLGELDGADDSGSWGRTFAEAEALREGIASGGTPEGMEKVDWSLWWALLEELHRLRAAEAETASS